MTKVDVGALFEDVWERLGYRPSKRAEVRIATAQRLFSAAGFTGRLGEPYLLLIMAMTDDVPENTDAVSLWADIKQGQWVKRSTPLGGVRRGVFHGVSAAPNHQGKYGVIFLEGNDTDVAHWHFEDVTLIDPPALKPANAELNDAEVDAEIVRQVEAESSATVEEASKAEEKPQVQAEEKPQVSSEKSDKEVVELEGDRDENGRLRNDWKPFHADVPIFSEVSWDDPVSGETRRGFFRRIEGSNLIVGEKRRGTINIRIDIQGTVYREASATEEE